MVLNHLLFLVLLYNSLLILVLATKYVRGFPHPDCSLQIRYDPIYLPHLTDCRKFYECDLGLAYEFQCPSEMHFNLYINGCDTPEKALCRIDNRKIYEETSQQSKTKTAPAELPVTTGVKVTPTTKTSLDTHTLQTTQENNSVNKLAAKEVPTLANISNHINLHYKISSRPYVASNSITTSRKTYWSRFTKPDNVKVMTRKGTSVDNKVFSPNATKPSLPEQQTVTPWTKHHNLVVSTRPRQETVSSTTRSTTSTYKKKSTNLKQKDFADQTDRRTSISRDDVGDLKKILFFWPITNNETIGENSVLNKLPVKKK